MAIRQLGAAPSVATDAATKGYVDGMVWDGGDITTGLVAAARLPVSTGAAAGTMSAADKAKLDAATLNSTASTIAMRDANGLLATQTPTGPTHAANKTYVDAADALKFDAADNMAQIIAAQAATALPATYPTGISVMNIGADATWPITLGTATTIRQAAARTHQLYAAKVSGRLFTRTETEGPAWTAWLEMASTDYVDAKVWDGSDITTGTVVAARLPVSTGSVPGTMSAADKTLIDGATSATTGSTLIKRAASGAIEVITPTTSTHPTTKSYVDTAVALKLDKAAPIMAAAQDLNTYVTTGFWNANTNATASGGTNYPVGASGLLEVIARSDGASVIQRYTTYSNTTRSVYVRALYAAVWSGWERFVLAGDVATELGVVDLDDYVTNGDYSQATSAEATSGTNYPIAVAGLLEVRAFSIFVFQTYTGYQVSNRKFWRAKYNGNWSAWQEAASVASVALKAPLASPAFTGTPTGITKTHVGLANVDNTTDANKPVSTATATSIATKEPTLAAGTTAQYYRGDKTWVTLDKTAAGLANVDNTSDVNKPVSTAQATSIATKEPTVAAGTTAQYWRGDKTWQTLDKTAVGLANVDNTTDAAKPVSTATTTQLNLKAPLASPAFTGTPTGITKTHVGLANVDNTTDAAKPVSTATATSIATKEPTIAAGTTAQYYRGDKTWQTLNPITEIAGSVDLDTFTTTSVLHQSQNADAASGTNYPEASSGLLEVQAFNSMVYQRYTIFNSGKIYTRSKYQTTWYAWRETPSVAEMNAADQIRHLTSTTSTVYPPNNTNWGPGVYVRDSARSANDGFVSFPAADQIKFLQAGVYSIHVVVSNNSTTYSASKILLHNSDRTITYAAQAKAEGNLWEWSLTVANYYATVNEILNVTFHHANGSTMQWDSILRITKIQ